MSNARLQLPAQVNHGELVRARLLVAHPMETGYLQDLSGKTVPRNVIRDLVCEYGGRQIFRVEPSSGISGNPFFEFFFRAGAAWDEAANAGANDPGVRSVSQIYTYYKKFGIATEVMGASFRNVGQITALAGCDLLTISPDLLAQLQASEAPLTPALDAAAARDAAIERVRLDEAGFRYALNADAMATEKLAEGIRAFAVDAGKLDQMILAI